MIVQRRMPHCIVGWLCIGHQPWQNTMKKNLNMDVALTAHPARKRLARFLNSQSIFATHVARHKTACATQNYTRASCHRLGQNSAPNPFPNEGDQSNDGTTISQSLPCNICTTTIGFGLKRAVPLGICLEHYWEIFTKTFTTISFKVVFPCPSGTVLRLN